MYLSTSEDRDLFLKMVEAEGIEAWMQYPEFTSVTDHLLSGILNCCCTHGFHSGLHSGLSAVCQGGLVSYAGNGRKCSQVSSRLHELDGPQRCSSPRC